MAAEPPAFGRLPAGAAGVRGEPTVTPAPAYGQGRMMATGCVIEGCDQAPDALYPIGLVTDIAANATVRGGFLLGRLPLCPQHAERLDRMRLRLRGTTEPEPAT